MYALIDYLSHQHRGICTWDLSQSLRSVDRLARAGGVDMGRGICLALSSHWIRYHAWDDSLVNHLGAVAIKNGHSFIPLNVRVLAIIEQCQRQWRGRLDDALIWLGNPVNDIIKVKTSLNVPVRINIVRGNNHVLQTSMPDSRNANTRGRVVNWAGMSDDLSKVSGAYAMIVLHGRNGGHACAAWIGGRGEDACFFDPNFGEYWFEDKQDFFKFLRLFAQNLYNVQMGMNRYEIHPLARRVRPNW